MARGGGGGGKVGLLPAISGSAMPPGESAAGSLKRTVRRSRVLGRVTPATAAAASDDLPGELHVLLTTDGS